jgi:hypothetical protein
MGSAWIDDSRIEEVRKQLARGFDDAMPVFTLRQVAQWGVSRPEVLALQRRGYVQRIRHGAYCLASSWELAKNDEALHRRILALSAMAGMSQPVYACGPFAAELHQLPLPSREPALVDLVRDSRRDTRPAQSGVQPRNRLEGVRIVSRNLTGEIVTSAAGVPVVGVAATAMTASVGLADEYRVALFDAALRLEATHDELKEIGSRWISTKGMTNASDLVDLARVGAESPLESISRIRLVNRGLPEPVLQQDFHDSRGFIGRVDMWWPDWRVIGEADGLTKYDDAQILRQEKIREDRLRALGLIVVRWTWNEMWDFPGDVVARIWTARARNMRTRRAG